ncbi:hypothetical protein [Rummeliibacillus suwonensis]|uniref:hypothetical protein n=1 Tax=Rummeliibacillus suwonensis TaxID=1306154 RepID=UPI001AAF8983|nr:hypothetical protein [Rummeliibacillus suwonensis]MBO2535026.1 hypothetical protein [Rummeliibacillus suwonensis]
MLEIDLYFPEGMIWRFFIHMMEGISSCKIYKRKSKKPAIQFDVEWQVFDVYQYVCSLNLAFIGS